MIRVFDRNVRSYDTLTVRMTRVFYNTRIHTRISYVKIYASGTVQCCVYCVGRARCNTTTQLPRLPSKNLLSACRPLLYFEACFHRSPQSLTVKGIKETFVYFAVCNMYFFVIRWLMEPQVVNAYYSSTKNKIGKTAIANR